MVYEVLDNPDRIGELLGKRRRGKDTMIKQKGIVDVEPTWAALIDSEWIDELDDTAFLAHCREGVASLVELRAFVLQQHYYSRNFTRYLCALLSNLDREDDRLSLTFNLFEELGLGEGGQVPHTQIYRSLMRQLGVEPGDAPVLPSTQFLVDCMFVSCRDPRSARGTRRALPRCRGDRAARL